MSSGAHALVFGASGLAGWGVVDQLLDNYPVQGTFSRVTALINRPFSVAESYWPNPSPSRPELELVSGVNLAVAEQTIEEFTALMQDKVKDMTSVTHAFYFAYKQDDDADAELKTGREMLQRAIDALNSLSPNLTSVVFPSGSKGYGIHIPGGVFTAPFKESMGRLPEPAGSKLIYYALIDVLERESKGKKWTWCDIRPDAIIGFTPNGSAFNLTAHWATYLSLYALIEGKGAKVPFPGTAPAYASLFNEASADIIARFSIWAALHPEKTSGELFNIADSATPSSMVTRWPALAAYFGLIGTGPAEDDSTALKPSEYIQKHRHVLDQVGCKNSAVFKAEFLDSYGYYLTLDRQLSLDKARSAGFLEEIDPISSWYKAFERFKSAGMIPGWGREVGFGE